MLPISVCMIIKNEEKRIERCLKSLLPYGFEIVIVDTGSQDRSKELASQYTNRIFDFEWIDDFSAARNFSLEKASNDWIFMMDCDEWVEQIDIEELQYFRKHLSTAVGSITRRNITGTIEQPGETYDYTERFFNRRRYHYTGRIHEQLTPKYEKSFENFLLNTTIGHDGYLMSDEEREKKSIRNISLLEKEIEEHPNNPYLYYQLAKGYDIINDLQNSITFYQKALEYDLDLNLAYVQELIISYGEALLENHQPKEALALRKYYKALSDQPDFLYTLGLIEVQNQDYEMALDCFEKATTLSNAKKAGTNSYLSFYEIGKILSLISEWDMARKYFEKCGEFAPAKRAIEVLNKHGL